MLVLNRKPGEQILIGDDVIVTLVSMRNGSVRIGIEAPRHMPIHRRELEIVLAPEPTEANADA
jgi:carbon storage regulator